MTAGVRSPDFANMGVRRLLVDYRAGLRTPLDVVRHLLERIEADSEPIWTYVVDAENVEKQALALDGEDPTALALYGIPFAVKDNIDVAGLPTTAGCPAFSYRPQNTAPVVRLLIEAGAILIGKTNLDQFATGLVGTRTPYGTCSSVADQRYVSGGSSSGSAVAVAKGLVAFALGTDTAGSGRVPAAFNGIVGHKPTRGLLSSRGTIPACRSLDCVSIFAASPSDAAQVLEVAAAPDAEDPFSRVAPRHTKALADGRPRIGVPRAGQLEFVGDAQAADAWSHAVAAAGRLADLVEIDLEPFTAAARLLYEGPWVAERTWAVGEFLRDHPDEVNPTVRDIILSGSRWSAVDTFDGFYRLAELRVRSDAAFAALDALLLPTTSTHPTLQAVVDDPVDVNSELGRYTNFVNLLDLCALALPAARRADGLPFGVSLIAPAFDDWLLLAFGERWASLPHVERPPDGEVLLAVAGAHLSGLPLNGDLVGLGAKLVRTARTAPYYRLHALAGDPPRAGLVRSERRGTAIEVELWALSPAALGALMTTVPAPLSIGTLELEDGVEVKGFLCEGHAAAEAPDISAFGGWRAYMAAASEAPQSAPPVGR